MYMLHVLTRTYNVTMVVATQDIMIIPRAAMSGLKALHWNPS